MAVCGGRWCHLLLIAPSFASKIWRVVSLIGGSEVTCWSGIRRLYLMLTILS